MKIGFTNWFGTYSSAEYTLVSNGLKELSFRLLTILLLYFNLSPNDYITARHHSKARKAAGWAGMLFAMFSIWDAGIRPKFKKIRLFDELALGCLLVSLAAVFYSMFENIAIYCFAFAGVSVLLGFGRVLQTWYIRLCGNEAERAPKLNKNVKGLLKTIKSNTDDDNNHNLGFLALILLTTNPEDVHTLEILKIVRAKYGAQENTTA